MVPLFLVPLLLSRSLSLSLPWCGPPDRGDPSFSDTRQETIQLSLGISYGPSVPVWHTGLGKAFVTRLLLRL